MLRSSDVKDFCWLQASWNGVNYFRVFVCWPLDALAPLFSGDSTHVARCSRCPTSVGESQPLPWMIRHPPYRWFAIICAQAKTKRCFVMPCASAVRYFFRRAKIWLGQKDQVVGVHKGGGLLCTEPSACTWINPAESYDVFLSENGSSWLVFLWPCRDLFETYKYIIYKVS